MMNLYEVLKEAEIAEKWTPKYNLACKKAAMNMSNITWGANKKKSRQVTALEMGLGSSFLERVVIPYANSPSTNPIANIRSNLRKTNHL